MTLDEFLRNNKVAISPTVLSLCQEGLGRMEQSIDILHDRKHIERIIADLDRFMHEEPAVQQEPVNYEVLLLALCWHDTWKATRFPNTYRSMLFDQYWDGYGSLRIFARRAREMGIDELVRRQTQYAIRQHGRLQFSPLRTPESRILKDLDGLEGWSLERLEPATLKFLKPESLNPYLLRVAKFYFDYFMKRETADEYYYAWSKEKFLERKARFLTKAHQLIEEYSEHFR